MERKHEEENMEEEEKVELYWKADGVGGVKGRTKQGLSGTMKVRKRRSRKIRK